MSDTCHMNRTTTPVFSRLRFPTARPFLALALVLLGSLAVTPGPCDENVNLSCPPLGLSGSQRTFEQYVTERLDLMAPPGPMEDWAPGLTIAQQTGHLQTLSDPWDLVLQYRVPLEYCPDYWPEHEPDKPLSVMCGEHLLNNARLVQGLQENPFQVAEREAQWLEEGGWGAARKLFWVGAYAYAHKGERMLPEGVADALVSHTPYVRADSLVSVLGPPIVRLIPHTFTEVAAGDHEVSVDMRVADDFTFDSVATGEQVLLQAAARGLNAVVVAGRGQLGDARAAERVAQDLRTRGKLPPDFRVIPGEYVSSRNGPVLAVFPREAIAEGQTLTATVADIHRLGGLAYLAKPGAIGAAVALRKIPFDGYLFDQGNFELFRTLLLLNDPRYADKPALYASNGGIAFLTGLPYTNVHLQLDAADPLRAGLATKQAYAASALYLPWMFALTTAPVAFYQKTLNEYFVINEQLAMWASQLIKCDHFVIRTTWDDTVRDLISLSETWPSISDILEGNSPLQHYPEISYIEAEYGRVGIGYDRLHGRVEVHCYWNW
jgi:hypothetical protein